MSILDLQGMVVPSEIRHNGPPHSGASKSCTVSGGGGGNGGNGSGSATASSVCIGPIDLL